MQPIFSIQNKNALHHLNIDKSIGLPNPYWLCSQLFQSKTKMHCIILILTSQLAFQILTGYAANCFNPKQKCRQFNWPSKSLLVMQPIVSIRNKNALHHLNIDKSIGLPNPYWLCSQFFQSKTKMHCIILILTSQLAFQILTGYAANCFNPKPECRHFNWPSKSLLVMQPMFSIQNQNADNSIGLPNPYWLC